MSESKVLYLDGGVLLNVFATGRAEEILCTSTYRCATLSGISREPFVFMSPASQTDDEPNRDEIRFDLSAVPSLDVRDIDVHRHQVEVVAFAVVFPDIYAKLLAAVSTEAAALATDDECVRRFMRDVLPNVVLVDTPELVRNWQRQASVPDSEVSRAVHRVAALAQFEIAQNHPLRMWWDERLRGATL